MDDNTPETQEVDLYIDSQSRQFLATFNKFQDLALKYGLNITIPSIVVVGGQSAGKSSLIEALLGFTFNYISDNMATKCRLILQMENDLKKDTPEFYIHDQRLLDLIDNSYSLSKFTTTHVKHALKEFNKKLGYEIDPEPLTVKVKYRYCSNLTIIDTPGFILHGDKKLKDNIKEVVRKAVATETKDTIIVCVENATQDPANFYAAATLINDSSVSGTVLLVLNKFDKEFSTFSELSTESISTRLAIPANLGKISQLQRYYTSMPEAGDKDSWDPSTFRKAIQRQSEEQRKLLETKSVGEELVHLVGFDKLREHLQREIQKRYQVTIPGIITKLQQIQNQTISDIEKLKRQYDKSNLSEVRQMMEKFTSAFARQFLAVMEGTSHPTAEQFGQTLDEELEDFRKVNPLSQLFQYMSSLKPYVLNAPEKVHGGAQYLRLLNEFQIAIRSIELGRLDRKKLINLRGAQEFQESSWITVANKYMSSHVQNLFLVDVHAFIQRLHYVLLRMFPTSVQVTFDTDTEFDRSFFSRYPFFLENLQANFEVFVDSLIRKLQKQLERYILATTDSVRLNVNSAEQETSECIPDPTAEQTEERVKREMGIGAKPPDVKWYHELGPHQPLTEYVLSKLEMLCSAHFKAVRDHIANYINLIVNGFCVRPLFANLAKYLAGEVEKTGQNRLGFAEIEQEAQRIQQNIERQKVKLADITKSVEEALALKQSISGF